MAVAAQAALLDELMGKGRNVSLAEAKPPHWSDDDMCKYFLAGLCPHELFNNTKDDIGPCEKVHDDALLESYKKSKRFGEMKYEEELSKYLQEFISTVESRIRRGENRLQKNGNLVHSFYTSERGEELEELTIKIEEALCKVEKLGTDGEVQQSRVWLDVAETLKIEKSRLEKSIEVYNQQAKELEICQTCGAFQVKGDAHQRIEEHLQGKMHLGYAQIREYLANRALIKEQTNKEEKNKWSKSQEKEKSNKDDTYKDKDKHKDKLEEKHRDRGKYRERSKDKYREKTKDDGRKRKRSLSRDKHHQSDKYSRREYDSDKHYSKHSNKRRSKSPRRRSRK